ncbi:MAG: GDSL-type esterase/lipase family protein, partial [Pirellulaceae bacterium]
MPQLTESQSFSIPLLGLAAVVGMAIVLLIGCTGDDDLKTEPAASHPHSAGGRFLALGDSYTIGESVAESDRWPLQLAELLSEEGIEVATPTIVARTGWTSGELLERINTARPTGVFEVVTLQIGVNDQFRGLDESQFARDLDALLDLAIEFASDDPSRVVVLSIPDWGVTPFAAGHNRDVIANEIDRFNRSSGGKTKIGNEQLLFHASRAGNWVGILGRGLQMPLTARLRRDRGMLGQGIYFGDSLTTALKYSGASPSNPGTYRVLVCTV